MIFETAYESVVAVLDRRYRLDSAIQEMAANGEFSPVVTRLARLRGVSTLTAFGSRRA